MAKPVTNVAASVRARLLAVAKAQNQPFDVVLVRYALERLLYRLSISRHRNRFVLKGGLLVTLWVDDAMRVTRDIDFLGYGDADAEVLKAVFGEIMSIGSDDGLVFEADAITADPIREEIEYGGTRLRTVAILAGARIPITVDIGFGDAVAPATQDLAYPSLLKMDEPQVRAYPPATVIAEKFQAMVALGQINGRMKDYYDLKAIPRSLPIADDALDEAIAATFARRQTAIPLEPPPGLSPEFYASPEKLRQWDAYTRSIRFTGATLEEVTRSIWALVGPVCDRISARQA